MNDILSKLPKPFFVLAPMDDVTDSVFRRIVGSCAPPDLYFTEFVNVDGLTSIGRPKLLKKLRFTPEEQPLIAQLWGLRPENYRAVAEQIADGSLAHELGLPDGVNFAGIDLNMGCPAKTEVKNGACAALMQNQPLAKEIIDATQAGADGRIPVSVKTRLGFSEVDYEWHEFLLGQKLSMLTIHGRTKKEMSKVPAHWDAIGRIREMRDVLKVNTLIVGNGDVSSRADGEALACQYELDGVMIGRGIFHDPYVFAADSPWESFDKDSRISLYRHHIELFAEMWQPGERPVHTLNKFCKIYIQGFDGAKELREQLMTVDTTDELLFILSKA